MVLKYSQFKYKHIIVLCLCYYELKKERFKMKYIIKRKYNNKYFLSVCDIQMHFIVRLMAGCRSYANNIYCLFISEYIE